MSSSLENLGTENRKFPPTPEFAAAANAKADMYVEAKSDRLAFGRSKHTLCIGTNRGPKFLIGSDHLPNGLLVEN